MKETCGKRCSRATQVKSFCLSSATLPSTTYTIQYPSTTATMAQTGEEIIMFVIFVMLLLCVYCWFLGSSVASLLDHFTVSPFLHVTLSYFISLQFFCTCELRREVFLICRSCAVCVYLHILSALSILSLRSASLIFNVN